MMLEQARFEEFTALISGIHGNTQKLKSRYITRLGLKAVHVFWLYLLRAHPEGLSASELAAAGRSNRSLVSREINELFAKGIIFTPEGSEKRRYGWKLMLTKRGERLADVIVAVTADIQNSVSRDIPEEDLTAFYRTLRILSNRFEELNQNNNIEEVIDQWLCD